MFANIVDDWSLWLENIGTMVDPIIAGIPDKVIWASLEFREEIGSRLLLASKDLLIDTDWTKSVKSISSLGEISTTCILFKSDTTFNEAEGISVGVEVQFTV